MEGIQRRQEKVVYKRQELEVHKRQEQELKVEVLAWDDVVVGVAEGRVGRIQQYQRAHYQTGARVLLWDWDNRRQPPRRGEGEKLASY